MKTKPLILMVVAVGCGLVAMLGVQQVISGRTNAVPLDQAKVLVAKAEVLPGTPLDETNVGFKLMPVEALPEGVLTKKEQYEGRAPRTRLFPGQAVLAVQLGEKGEYGASMEIPKGMRVVTVPVNATMTHSGLMKAGDRVDVLVSYQFTKPKGGQVARTRTVLQYIEVWATDQNRVGSEEDPKKKTELSKNVSLLVFPGQASLLKLAETKGEISLILRSRHDVAPVEETVDFDDEALEKRATQLFGDLPEEDREAKPETVAAVATPEPAPEPAPAAVEPAPVEPAPQPETSVAKPDFSAFVNALTAPAAPPAPKPEPPRWKVEIYNGNEKQVAEFPDEQAEAAQKAAEARDGEGSNVTNLFQMISPLFRSRKASDTRDTPVPLPTVAPVDGARLDAAEKMQTQRPSRSLQTSNAADRH